MTEVSKMWEEFERRGLAKVEEELAKGLYGGTRRELAASWISLKRAQEQSFKEQNVETRLGALVEAQKQIGVSLGKLVDAANKPTSREARAALAISMAALMLDALNPGRYVVWLVLVLAVICVLFLLKKKSS